MQRLYHIEVDTSTIATGAGQGLNTTPAPCLYGRKCLYIISEAGVVYAAEEDGGRDREEQKRGDRDGHENGHHHRDHDERDRPRVYTDGASAQGADLKYGLNYGGAAPQALQKDNRWPAQQA